MLPGVAGRVQVCLMDDAPDVPDAVTALFHGDRERAARIVTGMRRAALHVNDPVLRRLLVDVAQGRATPAELARNDAFGAMAVRAIDAHLEKQRTQTPPDSPEVPEAAVGYVEEHYGAKIAEMEARLRQG
jgi:hypothetical protein